MTLRQVSRDQFFGPIHDRGLDVHPEIVTSRYPYTADWRFHRRPGRPLYGRTVGRIEGAAEVTDYFVADATPGA